uniref:Uncharacterized protein n=1 Tax=Arion vulgaris TaxID=1028688 RepID=A0A0B7B5F6_9EUPU
MIGWTCPTKDTVTWVEPVGKVKRRGASWKQGLFEEVGNPGLSWEAIGKTSRD